MGRTQNLNMESMVNERMATPGHIPNSGNPGFLDKGLCSGVYNASLRIEYTKTCSVCICVCLYAHSPHNISLPPRQNHYTHKHFTCKLIIFRPAHSLLPFPVANVSQFPDMPALMFPLPGNSCWQALIFLQILICFWV